MASKRVARLNEQLKREIAGLIQTDVRDPRVGVVTVTGVQVAGDLTFARVFVRTLGSDSEREESLKGLQAASPFLRRALGRMLHVRRIPELRFQEDRSLEHARRIEQILDAVLPEGEEDQDGTEGADEGGAEPESEASSEATSDDGEESPA